MGIDRREFALDEVTPLLMAMQGLQAGLWTALPGIVRGVDRSKGTVSVEPTIQARFADENGDVRWISIPLLVDVPIVFPSGGGFTLTFPIADGDECLVVFSSRCIDAWWDSGKVSIQSDLRMHDLSDGFAIVGPRSRPNALNPIIAGSAVELRNDEKTTYISINSTGDVRVDATGDVDVFASGNARVIAPSILLSGAVTVTGSLTVNGDAAITGTVTNGGTTIGNDHIHPGGTLPSGFTGTPT